MVRRCGAGPRTRHAALLGAHARVHSRGLRAAAGVSSRLHVKLWEGLGHGGAVMDKALAEIRQFLQVSLSPPLYLTGLPLSLSLYLLPACLPACLPDCLTD